MKTFAVATVLAAALATPAAADPALRDMARNPVLGKGVNPVPLVERPLARPLRTRPRPARYSAYVAPVPAAGPVYGPEPRYYPGYGNASPNAGFGAFAPAPVAVVQYREAYIGRGLFYNTPPEPHWPSSTVISVRN